MPQLILRENTSIKTIKTLHDQLRDALAEDGEIAIDFSQLSRVDLSVVQLILSAVKSARKSGRTLKFKHVSEEIRSQFQLAGLMKKWKE